MPEPDRPIDLRSDTLSTPTEAMRRAMATADVGDDVYGEDPTALALEVRTAELLGKQAALFFPSGTMANQVAIHLQAGAGDEVLVEAASHTLDWEMGGAAALSGVQVRPVRGEAGILRAEHVEPWLRPRSSVQSRIRLLVVENTHNMCGGRVVPLAACAEVTRSAHAAGLRCHLDGARLFNAAVATGVSAARYAEPFDTVMVSLSKGLSAPVGSVLAGEAPLIDEARRVRRMFGGGMRQVGVVAAAGLVALEQGIERLAEDHANARALARGLTAGGRVRLAYGQVETNILALDVSGTGLDAEGFRRRAAQLGVLCSTTMAGAVRMLTYRDIGAADVAEAVRRLAPLVGA